MFDPNQRPAPLAWTDVNEALPTERQRVLIWNGYETVEGCYAAALGRGGGFGILTSAGPKGRAYDHVTGVLFWAPLITVNRAQLAADGMRQRAAPTNPNDAKGTTHV